MGVDMPFIYAFFILAFVGMAIWMMRRVKSNRERMIEENTPAVAGADTISGSIENDGRYDEPSEEDLEQMEKLLDDAAESQGIPSDE